MKKEEKLLVKEDLKDEIMWRIEPIAKKIQNMVNGLRVKINIVKTRDNYVSTQFRMIDEKYPDWKTLEEAGLKRRDEIESWTPYMMETDRLRKLNNVIINFLRSKVQQLIGFVAGETEYYLKFSHRECKDQFTDQYPKIKNIRDYNDFCNILMKDNNLFCVSQSDTSLEFISEIQDICEIGGVTTQSFIEFEDIINNTFSDEECERVYQQNILCTRRLMRNEHILNDFCFLYGAFEDAAVLKKQKDAALQEVKTKYEAIKDDILTEYNEKDKLQLLSSFEE